VAKEGEFFGLLPRVTGEAPNDINETAIVSIAGVIPGRVAGPEATPAD
jgi:hypothetical protein